MGKDVEEWPVLVEDGEDRGSDVVGSLVVSNTANPSTIFLDEVPVGVLWNLSLTKRVFKKLLRSSNGGVTYQAQTWSLSFLQNIVWE